MSWLEITMKQQSVNHAANQEAKKRNGQEKNKKNRQKARKTGKKPKTSRK